MITSRRILERIKGQGSNAMKSIGSPEHLNVFAKMQSLHDATLKRSTEFVMNSYDCQLRDEVFHESST